VSAPPTVLAVCADDFGLSPGVCRGIARLADRRRLTAVSCLANAAHWRASAPMLRDWPGTVAIGLHFNLTEGQPLSAELRRAWPRLPSLPRLIVQAHLRVLPVAALAAELAAQSAAFVDAAGRAPDFVDGHQHVHHLPQVRDVLLEALADGAAAVRSTARVLGPGYAAKRALISGTGGAALARELARRGIRHNAALLGVYDFVPGRYRDRMRGWLAAAPENGGLLFCHPGDRDASGVPDAIAAAREDEAAYFAGAAWADDLAAAGVELGQAWPVQDARQARAATPGRAE
jgi:predicted glycoside hydrolase/deacetylase ChbG (UPF0249 family)